MRFQSPLARVIGLGSAKEGASHWWWQRLSAIALVPLSLWFIFSVVSFAGPCSGGIHVWLASSWTSTLMIAFVVCLFYHAQLGVQVVLEDYLHNEMLKIISIWTVKFLSILLVISSTVSILQIALD